MRVGRAQHIAGITGSMIQVLSGRSMGCVIGAARCRELTSRRGVGLSPVGRMCVIRRLWQSQQT